MSAQLITGSLLFLRSPSFSSFFKSSCFYIYQVRRLAPVNVTLPSNDSFSWLQPLLCNITRGCSHTGSMSLDGEGQLHIEEQGGLATKWAQVFGDSDDGHRVSMQCIN
jgi:hypothetical protein